MQLDKYEIAVKLQEISIALHTLAHNIESLTDLEHQDMDASFIRSLANVTHQQAKTYKLSCVQEACASIGD